MIVVITGAGRRLGYELASHFLSAGHTVVGCYRTHYTEVDDLRQRGADLTQVELTDLEAVDSWIQGVVTRYPHISLLLHNASAFRPVGDDPKAELKAFAEYFQVHMQVPFLLNERCADALRACPDSKGNIIHITDIFTDRPSPRFRTYCATKAGLGNMSHAYARLLAPEIRVNTIQPGPLEFLPEHSEEARVQVLQETPLQRMGGFGPVVQTVDYILANDYLTGASIPVDGGRSL
ncbi:MAG: SDR family oxidoreductase [Natronospirillum sp.]|uniref:SDR family oxidoreductase n=1 Tax=Natronospirillum sp. TaxID=2812955 RepID=UPI0025D3F63F|nr:SDR family oxidoreductase [Natronospirillum sp.]MCH8550923.1 SDR family oxidoreductase [Natronospirillum sp.]